jgi:TPR repeat protein
MIALVAMLASAGPTEDACLRGDPVACTLAAFEHLEDTPTDLVRAAALLQRGCDGGLGLACSTLGGLIASTDERRAVALYQAACVAPTAPACSNLAVRTLRGEGLEQDIDVGLGLLRKGCAGGEGMACGNLGVLHRDGTYGVDVDPTRAVELWKLGCALDEPEPCEYLGLALAKGDGTARDPVAAVAALDKACSGHRGSACSALVDLFSNGEIVARSPDRAAQYRASACALGETARCDP